MFSSFGNLFCERFCHWTQQVLFCPSPVQPRWPWASLATQFFLETTSPPGCGADSSLAWLSPSDFFFFPWCSRASKGIDPLSALMFSGPFNPLPSSIYHLPIMSPKSVSEPCTWAPPSLLHSRWVIIPDPHLPLQSVSSSDVLPSKFLLGVSLSVHPHRQPLLRLTPALPGRLQCPPRYPRTVMFPLILHAAAGAIFLKHGERISLCLKTHHWTTINLGIKLSLLTGPFWSGLPLSQPHHHHSALFLVRQEHRVLCHCRTLHVLCPPHILNLSPVLSHWIILTLYSGLQLKRHFFWDVFPDYSSPGFSSTKCVESLSSVLPEHPLQILLFASFDCLFP